MLVFASHSLLRDYLEAQGKTVYGHRLWKSGGGRKKRPEEIIAWEWQSHHEPGPTDPASSGFFLFSSDISRLQRGLLISQAELHEGISPGVLRKSEGLRQFLIRRLPKQAAPWLAEWSEVTESLDRYLLLPSFPAIESHRQEVEAVLREVGWKGVFSFRSILFDLIQRVEANASYQASPALEILRLLKVHDLTSDPQMRLF